jgi:hypothetical protein
MVPNIDSQPLDGPVFLEQLNDQAVLEALTTMIAPPQIAAVLAATGRRERRRRQLPAQAVVWLVIGMGLWSTANIPTIWRRLCGTLRGTFLALAGRRGPVKSAFSAARKRLGAAPLRQLFRRTVRPAVGPETGGAFYRGLRLRVIDGVHLDVPDTAANAAAFGRPSTTRNGQAVAGAYPQVLVVYLQEAGTHTIQEALLRRATSSEHSAAGHLLRQVPAGDLVLWDRGFHSYALLAQARKQRVEVLGRVPSYVRLRPLEYLPDGSYLAKVLATWRQPAARNRNLTVRVLDYTLDDPARPGYGERHRLLTTLIEVSKYPARELISLYHERWEIELANDEWKTPQLGRQVPVRSLTPTGVIQEVYGLLTAYNAVRGLMHEAALAAGLWPRQLSFVGAVRVIRDSIALMRNARTAQLPLLYRGLLIQIAQGRLPPRENRVNPRVVKQKLSKFAQKRPHHYRPPRPTKTFSESVVMLN